MATALFRKSRHPACFAPAINPGDLPAIRQKLTYAGTSLKAWDHPLDPVNSPDQFKHAQAVLADQSGKFDPLAKKIATQYITGQPTVSADIFPPLVDLLCTVVEKFFETPESSETPEHPDISHPLIDKALVPLADDEVARMWDLVPWGEEIEMYFLAMSCLPTGVELDTAASPPANKVVHQQDYEVRNLMWQLKWYAAELYCDREPSTQELMGV